MNWLGWVARHRAITPWYLVRYLRFVRLRLCSPHIVCEGLVFLDRGVRVQAARGQGRLTLGRWVHVGAGTAVRCHQGTLRVGDKTVFGRLATVDGYLDIDIGQSVLVADQVYISDFDHRTNDRSKPIKDQGIAKARVRVEDDVWLGVKSTVVKGVVVGRGSVVGANAVVTRDVAPFSVAVGVPARVVATRGGE